MQDFEWIQRLFIGIGGSVSSFMLETYSIILSAIAATLTAFYMYQQIMYMHFKKNASEKHWDFESEKRKFEREKQRFERKKMDADEPETP